MALLSGEFRLAPLEMKESLIGGMVLLLGSLWGGPARAQPETEPNAVYEAPSPVEEAFGAAVADVGDVDGDGRADLVVGAPHATVNGTPKAGRIFLLNGTNGVVLRIIDSPQPNVGGRFGSAVAGIGDVTGDGTPDLAVGADGDSSRAGRAYFIDGADGTMRHTLTSPNATEEGLFAQALAPLGDATGDEVPDLLVAALGEDRVYLIDGAKGAVRRTLAVETDAHAHFGHVAVPGDVTGDGTPDVLVGASTATVGDRSGAGRAYLFDGRDGTRLRTLTEPAPHHGHFGYLVAGVGDVDGDETPDVAVGAASGPADGGTVTVYSAADGTVLHTFSPPAPTDDGHFGYEGVGLSDVGGDGTSGLLLGTRVPVPDGEHAGRAHLIGVRGNRLRTFSAPEAGPTAGFGSVVATLSEPGDSAATAVLVGAPGAAVDGTDGAGRVYRFALP